VLYGGLIAAQKNPRAIDRLFHRMVSDGNPIAAKRLTFSRFDATGKSLRLLLL
jgi:hypothetical protein